MTNPRHLSFANTKTKASYHWYLYPSVRALTKQHSHSKKHPYYGVFSQAKSEYDDEPGILYEAFIINMSKHKGSSDTLVHECTHASRAIYAWHRRRKLLPETHDKEECVAYLTEALFHIYRKWEELGFPHNHMDEKPYRWGTNLLSKMTTPGFWRRINAARKGLNT